MTFLRHRDGSSDDDVGHAALVALIAELDAEDPEHPDVSVVHTSEWALSVFPSGLVVWEDTAADDPPSHLTTSRAGALALLQALARGDLATVHAQPWRPGYGP